MLTLPEQNADAFSFTDHARIVEFLQRQFDELDRLGKNADSMEKRLAVTAEGNRLEFELQPGRWTASINGKRYPKGHANAEAAVRFCIDRINRAKSREAQARN